MPLVHGNTLRSGCNAQSSFCKLTHKGGVLRGEWTAHHCIVIGCLQCGDCDCQVRVVLQHIARSSKEITLDHCNHPNNGTAHFPRQVCGSWDTMPVKVMQGSERYQPKVSSARDFSRDGGIHERATCWFHVRHPSGACVSTCSSHRRQHFGGLGLAFSP